MAKTASKKIVKKVAPKPARRVVTAPKAASAPKKAEISAKETAKQEAARGKLERVKVPAPKREDGVQGKYVYNRDHSFRLNGTDEKVNLDALLLSTGIKVYFP